MWSYATTTSISGHWRVGDTAVAEGNVDVCFKLCGPLVPSPTCSSPRPPPFIVIPPPPIFHLLFQAQRACSFHVWSQTALYMWTLTLTNAGRTTAKTGRPCPYWNCSRWTPAENTGRGSLVTHSSGPIDDPTSRGTELNCLTVTWRRPLPFLQCWTFATSNR